MHQRGTQAPVEGWEEVDEGRTAANGRAKNKGYKTRFMRKGIGFGGARRGCARWGASMTALLLLWRVTCVILAGGGTARPLNTCKSPLAHRLGVGTCWGDETGRISQASSWPSWIEALCRRTRDEPTDSCGRMLPRAGHDRKRVRGGSPLNSSTEGGLGFNKPALLT